MWYATPRTHSLKERFVNHFGVITKPIPKHFSQNDHKGIDDVKRTILEFIRMPPRSPQAAIRQRVERNWTHTLRTLAPQGLNLETSKQYTSNLKQKC